MNQAKTEMSDVLDSLIHRRDLTEAQSAYAMEELLQGNLSDAEISAFITLLRAKGETASELASLIPTMWDFSPDVSSVDASGSIDTCGTGGDNSGTINISTAASFVVAACGVPVAKHGNRAASSKCGAADVLEELGVSTQLSAEQSMQLFNELHYAFLFAPTFHPGMRFAAPVRSQLKVRTTFNFLGPLANPFHAPYRLHGVSDASILNVYAHTLDELGVERAYVFHGHGGLDEISLSGPSSGLFLDGHTITPVDIDPADYGIAYTDASQLAGADAATNASIIRDVLSGSRTDAYRDAIALNAAAALWVARGTSLAESYEQVTAVLDSGDAFTKLNDVAKRSHELLSHEK